MNEGVKILLERMKTNPEEFTDGAKWAGLIHGYKVYLSVEDAKILDDAFNELMQQTFTEKVMKELLAPEEDDDMGKWFSAQKIGTPRGGATLGAYSNTAHATIEIQRAQMQAIQPGQVYEIPEPLVNKKPTIKVRKPQHKTLFGKLFNYS